VGVPLFAVPVAERDRRAGGLARRRIQFEPADRGIRNLGQQDAPDSLGGLTNNLCDFFTKVVGCSQIATKEPNLAGDVAFQQGLPGLVRDLAVNVD
jgi:hypothetical protein